MNQPTTVQHRKLGNLEGLRGFAALAVVFFHVRLYFLPNSFPTDFSLSLHSLGNHLLTGLLDGGLAVYIFWTMSGYVISVGFFRRSGADRNDYLAGAFSKRYFRLMPPVLASTILSWLVLKMGLLFHLPALSSFSLSETSGFGTFWRFEPNFLDALTEGLFSAFFSYNAMDSYNRVLWTIGPELFGSFLVYSLLGALRDHSLRWYIYGAVFVLLAWFQSPLAAFIVGLSYVDYDMNKSAGFPRAIRELEESLFSRRSVYVFVLMLCLMLCAHAFSSVWVSSLVDLGAAAFITRLSFRDQFLNRCLSSGLGRFLGRVSFGLYLTHEVVIASIGCAVPLVFPELDTNVMFALILGVSVLGSIVAGWGMYLVVDKHSQNFASWIVSRLQRSADKSMENNND